MILLLPAACLLTAAALVVGLGFITPARISGTRLGASRLARLAVAAPALAWLAAVTGALGAWAAALLLRQSIPLTLQLAYWQPPTLFPASPALLLDQTAWAFLLAVGTLCLAALLTVAVPDSQPGMPRASLGDLTGILALSAAALLAVISANLLTLLLAWAALDLLGLFTWLSRSRRRLHSRQSVMAYSTRSIGLLLLVVGAINTHAAGLSLSVTLIRSPLAPYLLAAAGLRLGVLPPGALPAVQAPVQRGLRSLLLLAPAAADLLLAARVAQAGLDGAALPVVLALSGLAALYGGLSFARAADDLEAHPHWLPAIGALAVAAAARAEPAASLAWSMALLLPGGVILLLSARARGLLPITLLGALAISALPFTPTWVGATIYGRPFSTAQLLLFTGQALTLAGYLRMALRRHPDLNRADRWVWAIYPWGLALPALTSYAIAWWTFPAADGRPGWLSALPGMIIAIAGLVLVFVRRRVRRAPADRLLVWLRTGLSFNWFYRLFWRIYFGLVRVFALTSRLLEGPAGVLWAILLLVLLATVFIQLGSGG